MREQLDALHEAVAGEKCTTHEADPIWCYRHKSAMKGRTCSQAPLDLIESAEDVLNAWPEISKQLAALERVRAMRCPVHGIPDCSPMLNGCSVMTAIHRALDVTP